MLSIIIINGYPEAGKDTFIEKCGIFTPVYNVHASDPVKKALEILGWKGTKTSEVRDMLARLKDASDAQFNTTHNYIVRKVVSILTKASEGIVFIHVREPGDIAFFKDIFQAESLLIYRPGWPGTKQTNHNDANVELCTYDITIYNDGTLDELQEKARLFVSEDY